MFLSGLFYYNLMTHLFLFMAARSQLYFWLVMLVMCCLVLMLVLFLLRMRLDLWNLVLCIKTNLFFNSFGNKSSWSCGLKTDSLLRARFKFLVDFFSCSFLRLANLNLFLSDNINMFLTVCNSLNIVSFFLLRLRLNFLGGFILCVKCNRTLSHFGSCWSTCRLSIDCNILRYPFERFLRNFPL